MSDDPKSEFWQGIWWLPDTDRRSLRSATLGECAREIQRLQALVAEQAGIINDLHKTRVREGVYQSGWPIPSDGAWEGP